MDVINTTIQLIKPCLGKIKVLAVVTEERLKLAPKAPTVKELAPELGLALWNGLFVTKGTPADVREKIAKIAKATISSDKARKFAEDTGAQINPAGRTPRPRKRASPGTPRQWTPSRRAA